MISSRLTVLTITVDKQSNCIYHYGEQMTNKLLKTLHTDPPPSKTNSPSSADKYPQPSPDLNQLLVKHPAATFFFRFSGHDGVRLGVMHGDLLIIDRAGDPSPDRLLLVERDGEWALCPGGDIHACGEPLRVWGVVTWILHRP